MNAKEKGPLPDIPDLRSRLIALHESREKEKAEVGRRLRGRLSRAARATILAKTQRQCHICGDAIVGNKWTADHVFSHSGGGPSDVNNYLAAHGSCNGLRWDYLPGERQITAALGMLARSQVEQGTDLGERLAALFEGRTEANLKRRTTAKGGRDV